MTEKRFTIQGRGISDHKRKRLYDLETIDGFISLREVLNELEKENEQLKQLLDLFASDMCKVTELLDDNNIEYELYNDVENFIVKWGVRIE
jgi:hypothetical protein